MIEGSYGSYSFKMVQDGSMKLFGEALGGANNFETCSTFGEGDIEFHRWRASDPSSHSCGPLLPRSQI